MEKGDTARLAPALNRLPRDLRHVHLIGICGTGMASLAALLQTLGYRVTGSDQQSYPPMSEFLAARGIPVLQPYDPGHLEPPPDLVIVGNVVTRANPEARELGRRALPYLSFPQALHHFALAGKRPVVVAGTHGKTTTTALLAWILEKGGLQPGFMVGGIPLDFQTSVRLPESETMVLEGDEYDTAFFDKGPKFLHYSPWAVVLTGIEFDHADIYRDLAHVRESFRRLIALIPPNGMLIVNREDPVAVAEAASAACPVTTYGADGDWQIRRFTVDAETTEVDIIHKGTAYGRFRTPLFGRHNMANLLAAVAMAAGLGVSEQAVAAALESFSGVRRRQERRGEIAGVLVLDDFAHHPTAVRETVAAVREKFPRRRLWAVFEPRSNSSRRNIFQEPYAAAFDAADRVLIPEPPMMDKVPAGERFSSRTLVTDLTHRGLDAHYAADTDALLKHLIDGARPGDVILFMSNGAFDDLPGRLLTSLE